MYPEDVKELCCPYCITDLTILEGDKTDAADGEILEGSLSCSKCGKEYSVSNGIPRFMDENSGYNASWNYKWNEIDRGRGLNYRVIEKDDPAYEVHDIFDRNDHGGAAYRHATGKKALDIGCGVGQCSVKLMLDYQPEKIVSMDLTEGVDVFRKVLLERYPQFKKKILMVQASVFLMPFRPEWFDYVFSPGVLHHTGNTLRAIRNAASLVKYGGQLNFWVYASGYVAFDTKEKGRPNPLRQYVELSELYLNAMPRINIFRKLPIKVTAWITSLISSNFWYTLRKTPKLGLLIRFLFDTVQHPDRDYRFINNFDGYVNKYAETWMEHEIFPVLKENDIVIKGIGQWRLGIWGVRLKGFYDE